VGQVQGGAPFSGADHRVETAQFIDRVGAGRVDPMGQTKDQQWKQAVECFAAALVSIEVTSLKASKQILEMGFSGAWHGWSRAGSFPSIDPDDLMIYVSKSSRRLAVRAAIDWQGTFNPYIAEGVAWRGADDVLDSLADEKATANDWRELAKVFVADVEKWAPPTPTV
jgi:hypothetical protein